MPSEAELPLPLPGNAKSGFISDFPGLCVTARQRKAGIYCEKWRRDDGRTRAVGDRGRFTAAAEGAENEGEIVEKITRCYRDDEDTRDWRECLTSDMPSLILEFHPSSEGQLVNLTKSRFEERLAWCCGVLGTANLPSYAVNELFELAVGQCEQMSAFQHFKKILEGAEFNEMLDFLQQERKRMERSRSYFRGLRAQ